VLADDDERCDHAQGVEGLGASTHRCASPLSPKAIPDRARRLL
jgi:hypothetical protein